MDLRSPLLPPSSFSSPLRPFSEARFSAVARSPDFNSRRRRRRCRCRLRLKIICWSLGGDWRKLTEIDRGELREKLGSWLLKARTALTEVAAPLVNQHQMKKPALGQELASEAVQDEMMVATEVTVNRRTPNGYLSFAAVVSIEQFARMNGLTGRKMQVMFEKVAPDHIRREARNLVEYCCFRYLSRGRSDFHPSLKDLAFQRLIFVTMLAWEQPYSSNSEADFAVNSSSLQGRLVAEEAFVRIAPAVAGLADISTAHHLFKALAGDEPGISFTLWTIYLAELLKVHEGRQSYQTGDALLPNEQLLCIGSSRKRPVLKWEGNIAWPGNLTLTDHALYFEAVGLKGTQSSRRLDLTHHESRIEKTKVGPFESKLFDSAVSVSSSFRSETWVLEFVDFGGEMRRDVWYASIKEVISLYKFIREYGPTYDDPSVHYIYGAHKGKERAITSAANSIARLQSLQFIRRLLDDPLKLAQFSYLQHAPYGNVVLQTLAVNCWGGQWIAKFNRALHQQPIHWVSPIEDISGGNNNINDVDGSVYLCKWMRSSTWSSDSSIAFWKTSLVKQGIILSKNLVVAELNLIERAVLTCKEKSRLVEMTQATIDAAMIKGIPSNIDLFKVLMLPMVVVAQEFDKLRRWEKPRLTGSFLVIAYTIIFRNLYSYVLPASLMILASSMLLLKRLKEQGRLGRSFGKVTIRDQPPSNTIQKIIALKEAMAYMESYLQKLNVSLLKIRTIILSGQPEVTTEIAFLLFGAAAALFVVPFKYILSFLIFDLFTRELEFRREMIIKFKGILKERWAAIHAAPVVVLPYDRDSSMPVDTTDLDQVKPLKVSENGSAARL